MTTPPPHSPLRQQRSGFTLIELLIVIAIVAVLAAVSIPIFGIVKQSANSSRSSANLREIGKTLAAYQGDNSGRFPPVSSDNTQIPQLDNWVSELIVALNPDTELQVLVDDPQTKIFVSPGINWKSGSGSFTMEEIHNTYAVTDAMIGVDPRGNPDPERGRLASSIEKPPESLLVVEAKQEGSNPSCVPWIEWGVAEGDLGGKPESSQQIDYRYRDRINVLYGDYSARAIGKKDAEKVEQFHWSATDYPRGY